MSNSCLVGDRRETEDDHWIFEQLGSPEKPARRLNSPPDDVDSIEAVRNNFEKKLPIYADNMRKLIITARKEISDLKLENTSLKQKLQASGLTECPACLFRFKPEREHRVLPKYIKVFRGKLSIEIEFFSLEQMSEWLTLNKLDENADGLPTMVQREDHKPDLKSTGSLLYKLVKEKQEFEAKNKKVVISIRPRSRDECTNASASSSSSDRLLPQKRIMANSAAQGLANVSKNCLESKCSNDSDKEDIEESFTSSHFIPKDFNSKHNQGEAQVAVKHCLYPELLETNQRNEAPSITDTRIPEQGENYDRDEASQVCCNELMKRMKNDGGPAANDSCEKILNKHETHANKGEEKTNGHQYPRKNDSSEWISNNRRTHVDKKEDTIRRQPWRTVFGKENASGVSSARAMCSQINIHETNRKHDVHVTLKNYSPRSLSKSLLKPMYKIGFSNEGQNEGIRTDGQYWKIKNENEISNKLSNIKATEVKNGLNEHQNENQKIDVEKCYSKDSSTSSRTSQSRHSKVSSYDDVSHRHHSRMDDGRTYRNRISLDKNAELKSHQFMRPVERHQQVLKCSSRSSDSTRDSKYRNPRGRSKSRSRRQHVGRSPADGGAKPKSPLRSPREKRRKRCISPLREDCRNVDSVECGTAPIPIGDLIVVDEEDVEDGEIVE